MVLATGVSEVTFFFFVFFKFYRGVRRKGQLLL